MIGEIVSGHRIISRLGRTGLGELWHATREDGSPVAIQTLPDGPVSFSATDVEHAHLPRVHESGVHGNGRPYLVLDPVRGEPLTDRLSREGRLSSTMVSDIAGKIAAALDALHGKGHVHRGLSTAGIYVEATPDGDHVTVYDAGLSTSVTAAIAAYAPPELFDEHKPDARADVYSLGCIAFELATGRTPFVGSTQAELPDRHRSTTPPSLASLVPDVAKTLDMLLVRMLQKKPDDRPRAAKELSFVFELVENNESVPSLGSTVKQID